jgi:hypothetical protein
MGRPGDVLEPDVHPFDAGLRGLCDKARDAVALCVDLDDQVEDHALALPELDQPVEDALPVAVAGEVVVGDEETPDSPFEVCPYDSLHIIRASESRRPPLDVDDRAEAARKGAAAAGIEACLGARGAFDPVDGQNRRRHARQHRRLGETVEHRQGVGRHRRPQPADHIPVVVIVGRLDQNQCKHAHPSYPHHRCTPTPLTNLTRRSKCS